MMGCTGLSFWITSVILLWLGCLHMTGSLAPTLRVGALFEKDYEGQRRAIEWAVEETNMDNTILPKVLILVDKERVTPHDSFSAQRKLCRMTQEGIVAMFGPISSVAAGHIQSVCNSFEIPHLQWRWDPRESREYFSISLYPQYLTLSRAYQDVIKHWEWKRFSVLYEHNEDLTRVQEVLKLNGPDPPQITVRKMEMVDNDYVVMLKELKKHGEYRFIVDCDTKTIPIFLKAALKLKMISNLFHYFFTSLDLGLVDLNEFKYGKGNITAFRLIDPDRIEVVKKRSDWQMRANRIPKVATPLMGYREIATETALAHDAFGLFARALHDFSNGGENQMDVAQLSCDKVKSWRHGSTLRNYMLATKFNGLSGLVKFVDGERYDFNLDLMYLTEDGLIKGGKWDRNGGLNMTLERAVPLDTTPQDNHYIVSAYLAEPYVITNASHPTGYWGFCVELLDYISKAKNFTYEIHVETTVGKKQANGSWNGVMGALIDRRAQIGIGDLTINLDREKHVDFTKPFLTLGITILYRKPAPKSLNLFSFLKPLSVDVWVYMIAAYLCVSFMLFVIARFSPYEWCNPHPCNPDTDEVENQFTVMNSLWFTIGSLMQQGCEIAPRALSTRMVAGMWWFFTLIMISSYTANLAAFLTVERMVSDINSAEDLAKQTKIKYGTYDGGATMDFFKNNRFTLFARMWNFMNATPEDSFVKNLTQAVQRVETGTYAYITESTTVDYVVHRNCTLMSVGGLLDSKGYGFATPQGSPIREHLTEGILFLQERQIISELRTKWWEEELGGGKCQVKEGGVAGKAAELGVENVGGVFVVLMGGVIVGFFVSVCEFVWKARKNAKKDKQTLCSEMSEEFRFAVRCLGPKTSSNDPPDEVTDNGLQFMPLTGYAPPPQHGKEVYA